MTDYMFKSYAETSVGEYYFSPDALEDIANYPAVSIVTDGELFGVEGEQVGELDLSSLIDPATVVAAEYVLSTQETYTGSGVMGTLTLPSDGTRVLTSESPFGVGGISITPSATLPDGDDVWYGSGLFGVGGNGSTPSKRASSIANCEEGNVKLGVTIDDVAGTFAGASELIECIVGNAITVEAA